MTLTRIEISGLRGFAGVGVLEPAIADGRDGSGLTILVGPNGGGKSTVLEAMRAAGRRENPSYPIGTRNQTSHGVISIRWHADGAEGSLTSVRSGSSETIREPIGAKVRGLFSLASRRTFNPFSVSYTHLTLPTILRV